MNKSFLINQAEWYFQVYKDSAGWERDSDALDGSFAMAARGSGNSPVTASGKETKNTKGCVVPMVSNREIIKQMSELRRSAPDLYYAAEFVFSGTADEVQEQLDAARRSSDIVIDLLSRKI